MRCFRSIRFLLLCLWCIAAPAFAHGQGAPALNVAETPAVPVALGHSVVALTGPWKFHVGDNPRWADPGFDDSGWENVDLHIKEGSIDPMMGFAGFVPGWTAKGHPGYSGFAWYRMRVRITGADEPLALMAPVDVDDSYQLFTNGSLKGSFGNFDVSPPTLYISRPLRFPLSGSGMQSGPFNRDGTTVIAFRFYMAPRTLLQPQSGGMHTPPVLGFSSAVTAAYRVAWEEQYRAISPLLAQTSWWLVFAVLILMLYVFDREETILLWPLGACVLGALTTAIVSIEGTTELITALQQSIVISVTIPASIGCWLMTWWVYCGLQDRKWVRNAIGVVVLWMISTNMLLQIVLLSGKAPHGVFVASAITGAGGDVVGVVLLVTIAWLGWRRPHREHGMLFLAIFFFTVAPVMPALRLMHVPTAWFPYRIPVRLEQISELATLACFSVVLLRRFRNSQRRQQAMLQDVKQAQEVQQVLIPEELPHVPGLTIESEYRPAREVGGDFFQIIPDSTDDSVLIVVGDVTGKGLQAGCWWR